MRKKLRKILVTGGAGFIGSAFVRLTVKKDYNPIVVDKLTYAGDLARLKEVKGKYKFCKADICDKKKIEQIFKKEKPEIIVHFAAESHVDRSIKDPSVFIDTNIKGTQILADAARKFRIKLFIHLSTDEIYGETKKGEFNEDSPIQPSSPYSSSKAGADLLIKSYIRTYDFPAIIVRPSNNYGPWQYPEKLIPLAVLRLIKNQKIPVYAKGENVREWLYVEDCADAILEIIKKGKPGDTFNLGSDFEKQNITVVKTILNLLNKRDSEIQFVKDRPGHDLRYKLNSHKLHTQTGWKTQTNFEDGMKKTVFWCLSNKTWLLSKSDI